MYASSLLPVLVLLASANVNAIAIDRNQALVARNVNAEVADTMVHNGETLFKRDSCWVNLLGIIRLCRDSNGNTYTSTSATKTATTTAAAATTTAATTTTAAAVTKSSSSSSSSSSTAAATTTTSSSTASASKSSSTSSSSTAAAASSSSSSSSSAAASSSSTAAAASSTASSSSVAASSSSTVAAAASSSSSVVSSIISSVTASSASSSSSSAVVTVVPTTSTATSTSSSSTSSAAPTPTTASVSGWRYAQGIQEGTNGRALTAAATAGQTMTVETCLAYCDSLNFPLAGLEYGAECFCGTVLSNGASLAKSATPTMSCAGNVNELCGGPSTLSLYVSTKSNSAGLSPDLSSQAVALPSGWASANCIQEVSGRALVEKSTASDDMTIGKCLAFCGNDFRYAGLEYGRECYCGNTLQNGASLTSTSGQCVTPCAGMSTNTCGGPNALQMYANGNYKAPSTGAYVSGGCAQEVAGRALRGASTAGPSMTIDTCTSFCASQGFKIAGLEYGQECYCDNVWQGGAAANNYSGQCNMPCAGNSAQNCGGPNAINFYTLA